MPVYKDEKTNTWYFSARYKDVYGNNKRKLKRGFNLKREAQRAETEFLKEVIDGYSDSQTFDYVFKHYLNNTVLRPKTKRRKENEYNLHIKPHFGHIKMNEIKQQQCMEFRTYLLNTVKSKNTARMIWSGFKVTINHAIKFFGLRIDPTTSITPIPRVKPRPTFITREVFDERVLLFESIDYQQASKLMFYTGLRVGECFALTWNDIHIHKKELFVNKTMDISNRTIYDVPKTESSETTVVYPQFIADMLMERYESEKQNWKYFKDEYFVFGGLAPLHYSHYHKKFKEIFPNVKIHSLRHSYASFLANNGVDIFDLQKLMRHARITETLDTYSHQYNNKKHEAMKLFD